MKTLETNIQIGITAIGGCLGWLLGGLDGFIYALLAFVVIDYVTGVMVAVLEKKVSSEIGFRGIFKKVLVFAMVAIGNIIDVELIKNGSAIRTAVFFSICLMRESASLKTQLR